MSKRLPVIVLAAATLGTLAVPMHSAFADGEKIIFSAPGASTNSNLSITAPGVGALNRTQSEKIQEELFHPLNTGRDAVDSMQGVFDVPTGPARRPQSAKAAAKTRNDNEARKNWAFKNMSILNGTSKDGSADSKDDDSSDLDSSGKKPGSLIEDFVFNDSKTATNASRAQTVDWSSSMRGDPAGREGSFLGQNLNVSARNRLSDDSVTSSSIAAVSSRSSLFDDNTSLSARGGGLQGMDLSSLRKQREGFESAMDGGRSPASVSFDTGFGAARGGSFLSDYGSGGSAAFRPLTLPAPAASSFTAPAYAPPAQNYFTPPQTSAPGAAFTASPFESIIKHPKL